MIQDTKYKILAIDTSCDETSAAVTKETKVLSNIIWSQAYLHAKWGGVVPSLAKREHEERIDWVIERALKTAFPKRKTSYQSLSEPKTLKSRRLVTNYITAVAVTVGPGLAIALEVGINKAKEISRKHKLPFIAVNHIEGHLLSPLARPKNFQFPISNFQSKSKNYKLQITNNYFPALGIIASGGHTEFVFIKKIGQYRIIAQTDDDALGESLDKAARLLGFGYPGGEILEKIAKEGNPKTYNLPIPMLGREKEMRFSYSGLKTALVRQVNDLSCKKKDLSKKVVANLAASYQLTAFTHLIRVLDYILKSNQYPVKNILAGGGVMANVTLRKMVRKTAFCYGVKVLFPYSKKLYGDNAAMIGVAANYKFERNEFVKPKDLDNVNRVPRAKVDKPFPWE